MNFIFKKKKIDFLKDVNFRPWNSFTFMHSLYISLKALERDYVYESVFIAEDGGC